MRRELMISLFLLISSWLVRLKKPFYVSNAYEFLITQTIISPYYYAFLMLVILITTFFLLKKHNLSYLSLIILASTTTFLTTTTSPDNSIYVVLFTLISFLIINTRFWVFAPVIPCFFGGWLSGLLILLTYINNKKKLVFSSVLFFITTFFYYDNVSFKLTREPLFIVLIAVIGLFIIWNSLGYKKSLFLLAGSLLILIPNYELVGVIALSIIGGEAIKELIKREWVLVSIRNTTILLVFCSLLFNVTSTLKEVRDAPPNQEDYLLLSQIKNMTGDELLYVPQDMLHYALFLDLNATSANTEQINSAITAKDLIPIIPSYILLNNSMDNPVFVLRHVKNADVLFTNEKYSFWVIE